MSRIGKKPVSVPSGVKVGIVDRAVKVEGPKGTLSMTHRPEVSVAFNEDSREVCCGIAEADMGTRQIKAYWGLTRSLIQNMVIGVTDGYAKTMEIVGVGWGAQVVGQQLKLQLGYADPVMMNIPEGVNIDIQKQIVKISGADKQAVGHFAAAMRSKRKPEPYNGKGVKYADEVIRRKQGKQFGA
jgi:large subunit ribosomal protein L6